MSLTRLLGGGKAVRGEVGPYSSRTAQGTWVEPPDGLYKCFTGKAAHKHQVTSLQGSHVLTSTNLWLHSHSISVLHFSHSLLKPHFSHPESRTLGPVSFPQPAPLSFITLYFSGVKPSDCGGDVNLVGTVLSTLNHPSQRYWLLTRYGKDSPQFTKSLFLFLIAQL